MQAKCEETAEDDSLIKGSGLMSSPSVRRSNSYRLALGKSGVTKDYIEQLDKLLMPPDQDDDKENVADDHHKLSIESNSVQSTKDTYIDENVVPMNKKDTGCENNDVISNTSANESMEILRDNEDVEDNKLVDSTQQDCLRKPRLVCAHWLCFICCCNGCITNMIH